MRTSRLTRAQLAHLAAVAKMRKRIPSNRSLASLMDVSERTIEFYMTKFMRKPARIRRSSTPPSNQALNGIDSRRFRQLLHLCHPDKHSNSETATQITQWLLAHRPKA